jgi:CHAD domain-containing protein
VPGLDPRAPLRPNAAAIVAARLAELRERGVPAMVETDSAAQHDMRIAAKRLRYVLEVFEPCFGPPAAAARGLAKDVQGLLGDIHDCDVLLARAASIQSLEALLRERRGALFHRFRELWLADEAGRAWLALERAL